MTEHFAKDSSGSCRSLIDLHVHSSESDGTLTPEELVDYADQKGLYAFALTDHDTVSGLDRALARAKGRAVRCIPGIELSTEYEGKDVHIVGLFLDYHSPAFAGRLQEFCDSREARNEKMAARLTQAGFPIEIGELRARYPDAVLTRAHFAGMMLEKGYIRTRNEAFEKYIGDSCPCYVPREKVTPADGVRLIKLTGGAAVFAHPMLCHLPLEKLDHLIGQLAGEGLDALEGLYATYSRQDEQYVRAAAQRYGLLLSGGSDFHGDNKPGQDMGCGFGNLRVPRSLLPPLEARAKHRREGR